MPLSHPDLASNPVSRRGPAGFSLVELLVAACLGLLVWGVMLQALVADGSRVERLVRRGRERALQRRALTLLRADLLRAQRVDLAHGAGAACGLGGRVPVLQIQTREGPITYTVGSPPSAIWRGRVLMRCGSAFGLDGTPSTGAPQNRVLLDGLAVPGLQADVEPDGLLLLQLRQEFRSLGGSSQGIETSVRIGITP